MTWCSFKDTTNGLGCDVAPPLGFKYSKRESNTNGHHPHKSKNTNDHFHLVACSQWMEEDIKPNITTSLLEDQIESCVSLWRPITSELTPPRTTRTSASLPPFLAALNCAPAWPAALLSVSSAALYAEKMTAACRPPRLGFCPLAASC